MLYYELGYGLGGTPACEDAAAEIARKAAIQAIDGVREFDPSIVFVFMTNEFYPYEEALDAISAVLRTKGVDLKRAPLIGGTVSAIITGNTLRSGVAVWILASEHAFVKAKYVPYVFEAGREKRIAEALGELGLPKNQLGRRGFLFTLFPGYKSLEISSEETRLEDAAVLDAICTNIGYRVPIFGGSISDDFVSRCGEKSRAFCDGLVLRNSAVLAWVETDLKYGIGMPLGYTIDVTGVKAALITKFKGNTFRGSVVQKIGHKRAKDYIDELAEEYGSDGFLVGARNALGSFTIANPIYMERARGAVTFHPEMDLTTMLFPIKVTKNDLIVSGRNAVSQAVSYVEAESTESSGATIFLASCRGKINRMATSEASSQEGLKDAEARTIIERYPHGNLIGFYGAGEQGVDPRTRVATSQTWFASALVILDDLSERTEMARVKAVDHFLAGIAERAATVEGLQESIVTEVNKLVMADGCSVFLRSDYVPWDPHDEHDRFVLVATSGLIDEKTGASYVPDRPEIIKNHYYKAGNGLTGWVTKYGVALRIRSRLKQYLEKKREELIAKGLVEPVGGESEVSPLRWTDNVKENRPTNKEESPYLAVPIKIGREIIGVVRASEISRYARARGKRWFSLFDEQVLSACGHYILTGIAVSYRLIIERETMELIIGQLGHALKNAVALVEANLTAIENEVGKGHESCFERSKKAISILQRAGELSGRFYRAARLELEEQIKIHSMLEELINTLRDNRITLRKPKCECHVVGDLNALESVFLEVINNALDFIDRETGWIKIAVEAKKGDCIVTISDNGPGVHPSIRDGLFEFFGGYPDSRLGMGLVVTKQVLDRHGATIKELNPKHGARFRIVLPLSRSGQNGGK